MEKDITLDLSFIPLAVIREASDRWLGVDQWSSKTNAIIKLADLVKTGFLTLDQIRAITPQPVGQNTLGQGNYYTQGSNPYGQTMGHIGEMPTFPAPDAFDVALKPVAQVADNANATALDALNKARALDSSMHNAFTGVSTALADLRAAAATTAKVQDELARDVQAFTSKPLIDPAKVSQAVTDAVAAAFKPFEQAVVTAGAQAAIGQMVSVAMTGCETALDVFGVSVTNAAGGDLWANLFDDPSAPAVDPCFVWTKPILQHLLLSQSTGENLWFGGEKGTGKSETVRQFAAKTGRGYTRINFNKYTTAEDFIGAVGLENGATVFKMGDFLKAFTTPASLILLDEITNADPAVLAVLNGFLESNSAVNYGGQVWRRAPNVLVFAADNTLTNGDESGRYAGTRTMNSALADRFARLVAFKHMELDVEVEAVVRHTGCKPALAEHVLKAVHACRAKVESGDIVDAPSIRSVIAFVRSVAVLGVDEAWAASIGHRQPSESATAIASIKAAYIDAAFIQRNL
jgi:MoxR-like ATPase